MDETAVLDGPAAIQQYLDGMGGIKGRHVIRDSKGAMKMSVEITGRVGVGSYGDNEEATARADNSGALVTVPLHGQHYEAARRGQAFFASSADDGIALITTATTGGHPTLWNPSGSGVNLSIIRLELAWASGTQAPGQLEWNVIQNAGSSHATGASIVTATKVDASPCLVGSGAASKAIWSPTTNSFLVAPPFLRSTGIALATAVVTAAGIGAVQLKADYDGDFVIAPDTAIALTAGNATTTALFVVTITWEEIPV